MAKNADRNQHWEEFKEVIKNNLDRLNKVLDSNNCGANCWDFPLKNIEPNPWYCGLKFQKETPQRKTGLYLHFNTPDDYEWFQADFMEFISTKSAIFDFVFEEVREDNKKVFSNLYFKTKHAFSSQNEYYQWCVEKAIEIGIYLDELKTKLDSSIPPEKPNTQGKMNTKGKDKSSRTGNRDNGDNTTKPTKLADKFVPIKYPITVKLNLSPNSINYPLELNNLKRFGDIQCRYMLNDREEALCFVLQEVKKNEQCIFGIKKNILQKGISEQYFRLDDNQGNGEFLENSKDAIDALPLTYGMTSSWAVGPKTKNGIPVKASKKNYSKILHDWIQYERFTESVVDNNNKSVTMSDCEYASLNDFNPSIVLLGKNWSNTILDVCHNNTHELWEAYWQNFQPGNASKGKGGLLRDSLEGTLFEKAYMTDIEKGNICTDSGQASKNAKGYSENNRNIFFYELQDLRNFSGKAHLPIIIGVWGKGVWGEISAEMKAGVGKWENCEFRLIGSHYGTNPVDRKRCISDFTSSMTWTSALYERTVIAGITDKTLLRHICYVTGITIQNELYRKSKDEGGFGAVGNKNCMGDKAVEFLYSETIKQAGSFPDGITDFLARIQNKTASIAHCFDVQCHERGKNTYDILMRNLSKYPSVSRFVDELSNSIKTMLS